MLINCAAYVDGNKLADIPVEAIPEWLNRPGCFVWVALADATDEELSQMQRHFGLHELAVEDARHGHQRPKIEEYGDGIYAVVQMLQMENGEPHAGDVNIYFGNNYVLSVRNRTQQNLLGVRERCEREPDMLKQGPAFVAYALMDAVVDRYFPVIDELEGKLEAIEDRIFEPGAARANIEALYALKRQFVVVKHAVVPLLEALGKLYAGRVPALCSRTEHYFRDVADHLIRIATSLEAARESIGTAIQVNLSMVAIDQGDVTKRLAAWAGIFAVATAFAGIWGMNFEFMPELKWKYGYPAALAAITAACGALYWKLRKIDWL
ncbi:MAG: magnesium and cobalt transport protein CorA [Aquabacterium sp.]|nr:MAG: magnesium and cobalt transport protein CorA [Aquabacterium sp.]